MVYKGTIFGHVDPKTWRTIWENGMPRKRGDKPTPAQSRAVDTNNCLRTLQALQRAFARAGHYDFEKKAEELDSLFRGKLHTTGYLK